MGRKQLTTRTVATLRLYEYGTGTIPPGDTKHKTHESIINNCLLLHAARSYLALSLLHYPIKYLYLVFPDRRTCPKVSFTSTLSTGTRWNVVIHSSLSSDQVLDFLLQPGTKVELRDNQNIHQTQPRHISQTNHSQ